LLSPPHLVIFVVVGVIEDLVAQPLMGALSVVQTVDHMAAVLGTVVIPLALRIT
jgi:hypothetical protein